MGGYNPLSQNFKDQPMNTFTRVGYIYVTLLATTLTKYQLILPSSMICLPNQYHQQLTFDPHKATTIMIVCFPILNLSFHYIKSFHSIKYCIAFRFFGYFIKHISQKWSAFDKEKWHCDFAFVVCFFFINDQSDKARHAFVCLSYIGQHILCALFTDIARTDTCIYILKKIRQFFFISKLAAAEILSLI